MLSSCKNGIILWISLSIAIFQSVHSQTVLAQTGCEQLISINFNKLPLEDILDSINVLTGLKFSYNSALIDSTESTSISFNKISICSVLDSLLDRFILVWTRIENQIVINEKMVPIELPAVIRPPPTIITIKGRVTDKTDKQTIPYAYIRIVGKSIGTITNNDGDFVFKYPVSDDRDIIAISCIGYKTLTIPLIDFRDGINWQLVPESIMLKEVLVRSNDPKSIIRKSLEAIPKNYRTSPASQTGFYRETLQKNGRYIVLSEAVVNIFKSAYNKPFQSDQVKVFKGRKTDDQGSYDTVLFKVQGGLFNSLLLDIAKNCPSFMDEANFIDYDYKMGLVQKVNDDLAYTIEFDQKDGVDDALYKGKLMVDVNTLAILGAEFSISPKGLKNAASLLVKKTSLRLKVKPVSVDYLVYYNKYEGRWQLNHIRMELRMRVKRKSDWFNSIYSAVSEMVITDTDTTHVQPFRLAETAHANQIFTENVGPYDASFWGEYNYIKPEEKLEETLKRLFAKQP